MNSLLIFSNQGESGKDGEKKVSRRADTSLEEGARRASERTLVTKRGRGRSIVRLASLLLEMKGVVEIRQSVSSGPIVRRDAVASDDIEQAERGKKAEFGCVHLSGAVPTRTPAISSIGRMTEAMSSCPWPRPAASI